MILNPFFELLRSGLWGKPADSTLFEGIETDWDRIYQLAQHQAVLGLVFDGIETLPAGIRPPRTLYMKWCTRIAQIEEANAHLNRIAGELFQVYQEAGLSPVLLKGQGIATCYPRPAHRQCGDIDIYVGAEQYAQAKQLITKLGATSDHEESIKHAGYTYKSVSVEIHRIVSTLYQPASNRKLSRFIGEWLPGRACPVIIDGNNIPVPPPTFNAVYLFIHAFNHFLSSGIGLRQLCDWSRLIKTSTTEIDRAEVTTQLSAMKLLKAAEAFAYVATTYLGLDPDSVPFPVNCKKEDGEKLLTDILMTGNFGQYDHRLKPRPKGYWPGKWYTLKRVVRRCNELRQYAPGEALGYPLFVIRISSRFQWNRLKRKIKR